MALAPPGSIGDSVVLLLLFLLIGGCPNRAIFKKQEKMNTEEQPGKITTHAKQLVLLAFPSFFFYICWQ